MAQANIVETSIDRVQETFKNIEGNFEKFQKNMEKQRKQFEKDTQKRVKKLRADLRKNPIFKRAETLQKDATKQIETRVDALLSGLQIASQADIKKLDQKLSKITRKLTALEKERTQATN